MNASFVSPLKAANLGDKRTKLVSSRLSIPFQNLNLQSSHSVSLILIARIWFSNFSSAFHFVCSTGVLVLSKLETSDFRTGSE